MPALKNIIYEELVADKLSRMEKLDKAIRALLGMGPVPDKEPPKFTKPT